MGVSIAGNLADRRVLRFRSHLEKVRRPLAKLWCYVAMQWALATDGTDRLLRRRFNRWARQGRGELIGTRSRSHRRDNLGKNGPVSRGPHPRLGLWRGLGLPHPGSTSSTRVSHHGRRYL
jgi:hypothetical protein